MNALDIIRSFFSYSYTPILCDYILISNDVTYYLNSLVWFWSENQMPVNSELAQMPNYKAHNVGLWFTPNENLI